MAYSMNLQNGQRAQRKLLLTVAEWGSNERELLGCRTEDSSIEFNPDIETSNDILGHTHTDVNSTQPQQDLDPFFILGGSKLGELLVTAALENNIDAYNGTFTVYVITAFISDTTTASAIKYKTVKHECCSIIPTSIGGDSYINMPIEVHLSNQITKGSVDKLDAEFTFTAD